MKLSLLASTIAALLAAAACGGGSSSSAPAGGGTGPSADGPMTAERWAAMDGRARGAYMKDVVKPRMAALFQEFEAGEFAEFGCKTCHGDGVDRGEFDMPTADLPVLTMDMIMNPDDDHAAITAFMQQQVVPVMAELLGQGPFDPATGQGFGCGGCHTFAE